MLVLPFGPSRQRKGEPNGRVPVPAKEAQDHLAADIATVTAKTMNRVARTARRSSG
jgi:hypothetical protein